MASLDERQNRSAIVFEQQMGFVAEPTAENPAHIRVNRQLA
ncbi:hypothetical protein [Sphingomonas sp. 3P27F8]|jgi:hypothetical protein|nr:hypothetical protein [Sphingomonas sp. 3P27F8]